MSTGCSDAKFLSSCLVIVLVSKCFTSVFNDCFDAVLQQPHFIDATDAFSYVSGAAVQAAMLYVRRSAGQFENKQKKTLQISLKSFVQIFTVPRERHFL